MAVLSVPVVLARSELRPTAMLLLPVKELQRVGDRRERPAGRVYYFLIEGRQE